jgi:hypothetical protein
MTQKKLRIFCAVANFNWENPNLIEGLKQCGHEVVQFDWIKLGYNQYSKDWEAEKKKEMNNLMIETLEEEHKKEPIQLFFGYLSDPTTYSYVIKHIKGMGIYTINYGCNNQKAFERANLNVAPVFDCTFYAEKNCGQKFDSIGAKSLHVPMAVNRQFYNVYDSDRYYYDTCFYGQPYGYRASLMVQLSSYKISYALCGGSLSYDSIFKLIAESKINCGFRGLGNSAFNDKTAKQIRLRDFEITSCGGFYFTEYLQELEDHYELGEEIVTFRTHDEFYDLIDYYLKADDERERIRKAGYERSKEHTWKNRFNKAFSELGII